MENIRLLAILGIDIESISTSQRLAMEHCGACEVCEALARAATALQDAQRAQLLYMQANETLAKEQE